MPIQHRPLWLAPALALILGAVGAPAAASGSAGPQTLGETTIVSTSGPSGRAVVTIPTDVRLGGGPQCALSKSLVATGTARHSFVLLTRLPANADSRVVWLGSTSLGGLRRSYDSECLSAAIPAGRYLLQHVHTPGTSTMRFRLPGLRGTARIATAPDDATARELPPVFATAAEPAAYSWGAREVLRGRGSVLTLGTFSGVAQPGTVVAGDCLLGEDAAALPDPVAYAPGCPVGSSGTYQGTSGTETWTATLTSNLPPGSYGAGYWYAGTPTHKANGAVAVWLPNFP